MKDKNLEELWEEFEEYRVKSNTDFSYICGMYDRKVEEMTKKDYRDLITRFLEQDPYNHDTLEKSLKIYINNFKRDIESQRAWKEDYYQELLKKYKKIKDESSWYVDLDEGFRSLETEEYQRWRNKEIDVSRDEIENVMKSVRRQMIQDRDCMKNGEDYCIDDNKVSITGPIYDDDDLPTYYITVDGNTFETTDINVVNKYRK